MKTYSNRNSRIKVSNKRLFWIMVILGTLSGIAIFIINADRPPVETTAQNNQTEPEPEFSHVEGRYLFSGTVVIARAVENEARTADGVDYNQPFSKFSTFNPSQYDAWEFDHECPMTTQTIPYQTQVSNTIFNCRPEFIPAMQKYFPNIIANIANNHTKDLGEEGYEQTVQLLEKAGVQTIGNYTPRALDDICEVIGLPVRLIKPDQTVQKGTLPIAFCAWHYFSFDAGPGEIEAMDEYASIMPVFAFMQVGVEYRASADQKQTSIARQLIDHGGPEFVIGNSPHWVQNTEVYKGKLIVYSTGNFIFDQLDKETNRGLSIDASMIIDYDDNVAKWLELGEVCLTRDDSCLREAQQKGLKKINIKLQYKAIGSETGYKQITQKANAATQQAIENRANWLTTLRQLGQ